MIRNQNRWGICLTLGLVLASPVGVVAQGSTRHQASKAKPPAEAPVVSGVRYDDLEQRDPFLNPLLLKKKIDELNEEESRGQPPPGISGMYISEVALAGVSMKESGKTAVFKGPDKRAYFLQEGDRLFDGFLRKIEPDSVLLVRETKLKSGKLITQDVPKRLRTP
jgi:hypothetical protein